MKNIRETQENERPRERLFNQGASSLSDRELLAVILGSGNKAIGVHQLSEKVLDVIDTMNGSLTPKALAEVYGIGNAKAALVCASLEFARRRIKPEGTKISEACDVFPLIRHFAERKQEHFLCISLNGANEVLSIRVVTIGLLNSTQVHPREVFADVISERAAAVIVAHNHPSGQLVPSKEDIKVTEDLNSASKILGIRLLDHIIFSKTGFYSFQEHHLISK